MMENYPLYYKDLYANVSWFRSGANVHIHERLPGGGFTRRGIALTEAEWESLVALAPAVNQALRDLVGAGPDGVWSRAIGDRGRRVEVNRFMGAYYVHVRNYWAQRPVEEPRPTRIGATLSPQAFNRLMDHSVFINEDMRTLHSSQAVRVREDEAFQARLAERRERQERRASDAVGTVPDPTGPPPARRWAPLSSSSSSSSSSTLQDPAPSAGPRPRPWFPPFLHQTRAPPLHHPRRRRRRRRRRLLLLGRKVLPVPALLRMYHRHHRHLSRWRCRLNMN